MTDTKSIFSDLNDSHEWQVVHNTKKTTKPQRYQFCSDFNDELKVANLSLLDLKSNIVMKHVFNPEGNFEQYNKLKTLWFTLIKPSGFVNESFRIVISDKYLTTNDELNIKFLRRSDEFKQLPLLLSISFGVNGHISNYFKF
jgi:hypothetical protein